MVGDSKNTPQTRASMSCDSVFTGGDGTKPSLAQLRRLKWLDRYNRADPRASSRALDIIDVNAGRLVSGRA